MRAPPKVTELYLQRIALADDQDILRLDVAVNIAFLVQSLNSFDELISQQKYGLEAEFSAAEIEQVFKRWPEHF